MKLAKWGNSLALRIPSEVVARMRLLPGEEVQLRVDSEDEFQVCRDHSRQEAIEALSRLAKPLPSGYKFNRDEFHERGMMRRGEQNAE